MVPNLNYLHAMSNVIFYKKKKNYKNLTIFDYNFF